MTPKSSQQAVWRTPFTIEPTSPPHTQTFILLHGLGSNGEKFGRELLDTGISSNDQSLQTAFPSAKFIFPTAKTLRVTALKRSRVPAWFDMYSLGDRMLREDVQIDGLIESSEYIRSIIKHEMQESSLQPENIVLGGISNGCALGLTTLLSLDFPIGAFVGLCARLPFRDDIEDVIRHAGAVARDGDNDQVVFGEEDDAEVSEPQDATGQALDFVRDLVSLDSRTNVVSMTSPLTTPVFLGHGKKDEVVPHNFGKDVAETLTSLNVDVTWRLYPDLAHWYEIPGEIDDILAFLRDKTRLLRSED
ncbi:phospholipase/carboxylesterase [Periconia macrospinosa]|uniref:Acyl-protein thioesterase 1 n=1 Tax=Periconia macrospinosa TaxID=97972 RepID=A0A2V1DNI9_9PLEO|nr:phospholipase/carboxylesterase [Periconia macrospinosa]